MVMRSVASVCLSVCPVQALTFESLDLETSLFVRRYTSSEYLRQVSSSYVKVIKSRSRTRSQEQSIVFVLFAGGLSSTERLSCLNHSLIIRFKKSKKSNYRSSLDLFQPSGPVVSNGFDVFWRS